MASVDREQVRLLGKMSRFYWNPFVASWPCVCGFKGTSGLHLLSPPCRVGNSDNNSTGKSLIERKLRLIVHLSPPRYIR